MYIELNQKIKIIPTERGRKNPDGENIRREKRGRITSITERILTVKTSNYNMTFNVSDIIAPYEYYLSVFIKNEWVELRANKGIRSLKELIKRSD
jgi:hypothetical protein